MTIENTFRPPSSADIPGELPPDDSVETTWQTGQNLAFTDQTTLDAIAGCLGYPRANSWAEAHIAADGLSEGYPQVAAAYRKLGNWLANTDRHEVEEAYTVLFDLKPQCTLDIGHHVYGEAYQRGALLAGLVHELGHMGIDMGDELPDYLPTVLRLVGRLPDTEERQIFIDRILAVGVGRMKKALVDTKTAWAEAVCALADLYVAPPEELDDSLHKRIRLKVLNNA